MLNEVHIWSAGLDVLDPLIDQHARILSKDEIVRARRFHFERDSWRFVRGRAFLRAILSSYVDEEAAQLRFAYGPEGKPMLRDHNGLFFNLSHSNGLALLGVTRVGAVGVDVEKLREVEDTEGIARHYLSPSECTELLALPPAARSEAFLRLWTCKEAYLKGLGCGLARSLQGFAIALKAWALPRLYRVDANPTDVDRWSFALFVPAPGFVGAIAVEGHGWHVAPQM